MNALTAYADLRRLGQPVLRTREVAARLQMSDSTANSLLKRLERAGLATQIRHGLWTVVAVDPLALPEHLTAPYPSYVSFETALFQHAMIQQIPPRVTVASVGKPRTVKTALGTFVIRQISARLFGGFEDRDGARIATPEKALFDTVYRAAQRGWKAAYFPEIELPDTFDVPALSRWIELITSPKLRAMVPAVLRDLGIPLALALDRRHVGKLLLTRETFVSPLNDDLTVIQAHAWV
ncbi:MAG: type IV toxin-antitoxin system AbiEi family antitoxin domain-containing protein [Chloroflexi bacterium]|nr:type IV toxin-antitoxin system AbiEi family antitoxin domain-containing protein [Chloroflexota bacterium]